MNDKLFIPKKIKVGYQSRTDTYTQMLAYVIYYDSKGKLCKETSWRGWIQDKPRMDYVRDDKYQAIRDADGQPIMKEVAPALPVHDFDNVPTSGFVLNKKAGGTGNGWDHRQMKCRVFDPRGFEFEIAIDNLLFILQESNSLKGKGLEGDFVYAWSGKDIVLLPCESEDYVQSQAFTDLKTMKVSTKELVAGYTYMHKNTNQVVYLGKYDFLTRSSYKKKIGMAKEFMFYDLTAQQYMPIKAPNLAKVVDANIISNYADLVEKLQESGLVGPFTVEIKPLDLIIKDTYDRSFHQRHQTTYIFSDWAHYNSDNPIDVIPFVRRGNNEYIRVSSIQAEFYDSNMSYWDREKNKPAEPDKVVPTEPLFFTVTYGRTYKIDGDVVTELDEKDYRSEKFNINTLRNKQMVTVDLVFFNDKKYSL